MKKQAIITLESWLYEVGDIIFEPRKGTKTKAGHDGPFYLILVLDSSSMDGTKFYKVMDVSSGNGEVSYIERYRANVDYREVENDGYDL
jgi:hypothetical protein